MAPRSGEAPVKVTVIGAVKIRTTLRVETATLSEALRRTQPSTLADLRKVTISRRREGVAHQAFIVNAATILQGEAPDLILAEGDVILVPEMIL